MEARYGPNGPPEYGNASKKAGGTSTEEMEVYLKSVFEQADVNGDGDMDAVSASANAVPTSVEDGSSTRVEARR